MGFSGKADQISESASLTRKLSLASVAACNKTPLILGDKARAVWLGETQIWNGKSDRYFQKKINAILTNTKRNLPQLANIHGYKREINWQNFTEKYLAWAEILQKVLGEGGLLFWLTL